MNQKREQERSHMRTPANGLTSGQEYFQDLDSITNQQWSPAIANMTYNHYPQASLTGETRKHHQAKHVVSIFKELILRDG